MQNALALCQLPNQTLLGKKTDIDHRQDLEMAYGVVSGLESLPGGPRQIQELRLPAALLSTRSLDWNSPDSVPSGGNETHVDGGFMPDWERD